MTHNIFSHNLNTDIKAIIFSMTFVDILALKIQYNNGYFIAPKYFGRTVPLQQNVVDQ